MPIKYHAVSVQAAQTTPAPTQAASKPQPMQPMQPISESSALTDMLASIEAETATYGGNLAEALATLVRLTALEGVSIQQLRDGFIECNKILLAKPELCTEVMLPVHLGMITRAAKRLTEVAMDAGEKRVTKVSASKAAKEAKAAKEVEASQKLATALGDTGEEELSF